MDEGSNLSWQSIERKGSVHWKGVYRVGECKLGVQNFFYLFLKLTNQRQPKVTCLVRH